MADKDELSSDLVAHQLQQLNTNLEKLTQAFYEDRKTLWMEVAALKVKAGLWGLLGGVLAAIPTLIYFVLSK